MMNQTFRRELKRGQSEPRIIASILFLFLLYFMAIPALEEMKAASEDALAKVNASMTGVITQAQNNLSDANKNQEDPVAGSVSVATVATQAHGPEADLDTFRTQQETVMLLTLDHQ